MFTKGKPTITIMFWIPLIIVAIYGSPIHAAPHFRHSLKNNLSKDVQSREQATFYLAKSWPKKSNGALDSEVPEFFLQTNQKTDEHDKSSYLKRLLRKRGIYDLNGPSEERALMEYYASMLVTNAASADRPLLKEKLGKALEMTWTDFDDFKNYCDELAKEVSSYEIVSLDDNFDLTDHVYSLLDK